MNRVWRWVGVISGVLLIGAVLFILLRPRPGEPVTPERLQKARELWARAGIRNYDLELEMSGAQSGRYRVEVREGKLAVIARGGIPATPSEDFYSVDGLFRTIEEELSNVRKEMYGRGAAVYLWMKTDPHLGYPVKYLRQVSGTTMNIAIEVTKFQKR